LHGLKPGLPVARLGRIVLELVRRLHQEKHERHVQSEKGLFDCLWPERLASALPLAGGSGATHSLIMFTAGAFFLDYPDGWTGLVGFPNAGSRLLRASVPYFPVVLRIMMAGKA
jgi:hypothetical protein